MSDDLVSVQMSQPMCIMRTKDIKHLCDRIEELEAKLAQQDDLVQAAVAAKLREAAAEIEAMRGPIDVPRTDKSVVFDEAADRCIEIVLNYITPDAQAALDRALLAEVRAVKDSLTAAYIELAAERERCARVAETEGVAPWTNTNQPENSWYKHGQRIAAAIRKGDTP